MRTKKAWTYLLVLCVIISFIRPITCYAHPTAAEHNTELESVLFERGYSKYQSTQIKNNVKAIEYASYLTIDQFGGNGQEQYRFLKNQRMGGLPIRFSTIDYMYELNGSGKQISATTHRRITHQGWTRQYEIPKEQSFWNARRRVLLGTVNSIFDFGVLSGPLGYDERCEALCGIIYYVHILGDYDEADRYTKVASLIQLAGRSNTDGMDIITQLKGHISVLFVNQEKTDVYKKLMKELDSIDENASRLARSTGGVNTDEEFAEYHQCAVDVLEALIENIPKLLKQEEFFSKVFYPNYE